MGVAALTRRKVESAQLTSCLQSCTHSGFDADKTYPLTEGPSLDPIAPPTAPPYKGYLDRKK